MAPAAQIIPARAFWTHNLYFYRLGTAFPVLQDRSNTWRLCNPAPNRCAAGFLRTANCVAKTYDCRCYNWAYSDYTLSNASVTLDWLVDPTDAGCVIVMLPLQDVNITFTWQLTYTYDYTTPTGWQLIMLQGFYDAKKKVSAWLPPFRQWWQLMLQPACDAAGQNNIRQPALDYCTSSVTLQAVLVRDPWTNLPASYPISATTTDSVNTAFMLWGSGFVTIGFLWWWWREHHRHHEHYHRQ
jgi:hypothetical protein